MSSTPFQMPSTSATSSSSGLDPVFIAVMGATGSGKSSFINKVSNSELETGDGLWSCTASVGLSKPFELYGRQITLVDTPGFDDTVVPDTDILKMIALYLVTTYQTGCKLSGVIYLHRISDFRVGGTARRNFNMFRSLCGEDALKNVIIATNMWGEVTLERGAAREHELATNELLFKPVLDEGARMLRYEDSKASAEEILRLIVSNQPLPLRIQKELVDEGRDIMDTSAGKELTRMLDAAREQYRSELADIQKEMAEALEAQDTRAKAELEVAHAELEEKMAKDNADRVRLSQEYAEGKRRVEEEMQEAMSALRTMMEEQERAIREQAIGRPPSAGGISVIVSAHDNEREIALRMRQLRDAILNSWTANQIQALFQAAIAITRSLRSRTAHVL